MTRAFERRNVYIAVDCDNCGGDAWVPGSFLGANPEDFPLGDHWHETSVTSGKHLPIDNGFCLDLSGHYGGFTDSIEGRLENVILCHDCSVAVARALPGIFSKNTGHHSMNSYEEAERNGASCCEFAWSTDASGCVVVGDGNGGWIQRYDPDGNIIPIHATS